MTSSGWLEVNTEPSEPPSAPPASRPSEEGTGSTPAPEPAPTTAGPGARHKKTLAIGLVVVIVASIAGWFAGRQIKSPAEVAAKTAPPNPSLITAPVEKVALSSDVVVRGTVRFGAPQAVTLPKSALKPGTGIVSVPPTKGAQLGEGTVALTVSGRPVLVLQGGQPAYRDLGPGDEGADVRQLEEALARLGFDPGTRDGQYDGSTAFAVAAWYRAAGYKPFGPTDDQLAALRAAEAEHYGGQSELVNAEESLAIARAGAVTAAANVGRATSALDAANEDRRAAQIELDGARAESSPPNPATVGAAEAKVIQTNAAIGVARAELTAANAEVANAADAIRVAQKRVGLTGGRERTLGGNLGEIAGKLGIQVPADEVLFFGNLPLRVDDVTIKVGEETSVPVMTVSNQELAVDAALSPKDARLVNEGLSAHIEDQERGVSVEGVVAEVADTDGTNGVDAGRHYLRVTPQGLLTVGASVVVTIRVRTTEGEVLAVPVAAVSVAADGTSRVQVQDKGGRTRYVTVTPGLAAKGMVELKSVKGRLAAGDLVVVGGGAEAKA